MTDHVDMSQFIAARSDQLNADDLLDAPRTITITKVTASPDSAEQPVSVYYEGDDGKPFKPCKTVRRIMVGVWGKDASQYVGRSMTLYRDPNVAFGGMQVGGLRVSHMSDISENRTVALQVTRGRKAPHTVKPLVRQAATNGDPTASGVDWDGWFESFKGAIAQQTSEQKLKAWRAPEGIPEKLLQDARGVIDQRIAALAPATPSTGFDDAPAETKRETILEALDAQQADEAHPATTRADAIIDEVKKALAVMDVEDIEYRERANIDAMPEGIAQGVRDIIAARKSEIKAEQEAAKKREVVG